ncbi:uncharacterized protein LOC107689332 isoform X4 [Sinocyclocheilus anshuiensis]|uniref:uncharacterized protein LOC107689332 isoform X4 n=1 Tax=Sinocyclocheilus anshuiensis TaxID=1608454 RepID=UPI0007BA1422|nr:PREDICTED: uncharacterized protein LOC107689332 isoform X4 [Sinocyclocheilus anshuiensis]
MEWKVQRMPILRQMTSRQRTQPFLMKLQTLKNQLKNQHLKIQRRRPWMRQQLLQSLKTQTLRQTLRQKISPRQKMLKKQQQLHQLKRNLLEKKQKQCLFTVVLDEADATKIEAESPVGDPEPEITPEEAPDDAEEEPAQEEAEGGEADADADTEADSTTVPEEPVEPAVAVEDNSAGFDLSDALEKELQPEDPVKTELGDADQHSSGQGRARSAGAVSEPNDSGSGTVVGVVCGIAVAAVGAIIGYFTYQKKKLCFKVQRGDPESAKEENGTQSHEVLSTLLKSSEHASAAGNELA